MTSVIRYIIILLQTTTLLLLGINNVVAQLGMQKTTFRGTHYKFYKVDSRKSNLAFHWKNAKGQPIGNFSNLERELEANGKELTFATNGGIFSPNLTPVGLYQENGRLLNNLNNKEGNGNYYLKPNGVFYITKDKRVAVVESSKYTQSAAGKNIEYALQSGPQLLIDGAIHPKFTPNSLNKYIRSGVGIISEHIAVFAISDEPVSFHDFASFFKEVLKCKNALYLDGTISSMTWKSGDRKDKSHQIIRPFSVIISDSRLNTNTKQLPHKPSINIKNVGEKEINIAKGFQYDSKQRSIVCFKPSEYRIEIKKLKDAPDNLGRVSEFFWAWREYLIKNSNVPKTSIYAMFGLGYGLSESNFLIFNNQIKNRQNSLLTPNIYGNGILGIHTTGKITLLNQEEYKAIERTNKLKHAVTIAHFLLNKGIPTDYTVQHIDERGYYAAIGIKTTGEIVLLSTDNADGRPGAKISLKEVVHYFISNDCQKVALLSPKNFAYSSIYKHKDNWNASIDRSQIPGIIAIIKK